MVLSRFMFGCGNCHKLLFSGKFINLCVVDVYPHEFVRRRFITYDMPLETFPMQTSADSIVKCIHCSSPVGFISQDPEQLEYYRYSGIPIIHFNAARLRHNFTRVSDL